MENRLVAGCAGSIVMYALAQTRTALPLILPLSGPACVP
jgi:hypothetical protein